MSAEVLTTIRQRGYWRVLIRPTAFKSDLVPTLRELEENVRGSVVQIRGWDYPHWSGDPPVRIDDSIEGSVDWEDHKEYWRAYQSGQFVHYFAMREDWLRENQPIRQMGIHPKTVLGYEMAIYSFTEIFLFAGRWTARLGLGPEVLVEIALLELAGRTLYTFNPNRVPFGPYRQAATASFHHSQKYQPSELIGDAPEHALTPLRRLFEQFRWDTTEENLREVQQKLLKERH